MTLATVGLLLLVGPATAAPDAGPLVRVGPQGLEYRTWGRGERVPDFSNCGYRGGGVDLPDVETTVTLRPTDDGGDDTARIQAALDRVGRAPRSGSDFRGAVLLEAGTYRVAGTLELSASGVVLRGAGPGADGSVVIATGTQRRPLIRIDGGRRGTPIRSTQHAVAQAYVPLGARTLTLVSTRGLAVGDPIEVVRPATPAWFAALGVDQLNRGPDDRTKNWESPQYRIGFERRILAIDGRTLTIDAPIVMALDQRFGGGSVVKTTPDQRIREVGVESLRLISEYEVGRENQDEDHAWDAIKIGNLVDGWVRDVTALHFAYSCVNLGHDASRITVQDCAMIDPVSKIRGGRRYSFALAGQRCLIQRCTARNGRHDFVTHARVPGPNVFLDCVAESAHSDSGPHHRWAMGTLFDNVKARQLNVQWRGRSGTGHGWAGANTVFWNCTAESIDCQKPPTAQNFAIGCVGRVRGDGHLESIGTPVEPLSLYRAQLAQRLTQEPSD
jgi:hypothetical protein